MTYRILEGVRRAKAAQLLGWDKIACVIVDKDGEPVGEADIPISDPRSRRLTVEVFDVKKQVRFNSIFRVMQAGAAVPPFEVTPGKIGIPIADVRFDLTGDL